MISYLELLQMVKNGNAPDLIYLHLNCGKAYYQMYYDGGEFDYYGICDENDEDENFKYYLADTLLESQMIEENIEIIEEPKKLKKMIIPAINFNLGFIDTNNKEIVIKEMNKTIQELYDRTLNLNTQINEIIDYINKGDNNDC